MRHWLVAVAALCSAAPAVAQDPAAHVLIISGLPGEDRFAKAYASAGNAIATTAQTKYGVPASNVIWLADAKELHARVNDRSTKENVERELRALAARAGAQDRVLIVLYGHGSFMAGESRINLPGPDITAKELSALLQPLQTQRIAIVNTSSASGGFVADLAAPNRVVITATKSGMEANETVFGNYFAAAISGTDADTDKDGRVSLLEAFEFSRLEVAREYQQANKLLTEHAVIDGVGDGKGVAKAEETSPHARAARAFFLGNLSVTASGKPVTPALRALYDTRARLQTQIDELRARKDSMAAADYESALEKLLVELSTNAQAIRRAEGS
jgi:hypothetical protein